MLDDILHTHPEQRDAIIRHHTAQFAAHGACAAGCPCTATATVRIVQPDTLAVIYAPMCLYHAAVLVDERDGHVVADGRPVARILDHATR